MWDQVWTWLANNYPLAILILIVGVAVWFVAKFYYQRFEKMETIVTDLPCKMHEEQYGQIKDELLQIKIFLMARNPKTATMFSVKMSPRRLNEAGYRMFEDFKGMEFLQANQKIFLDAIDEKKPKTPLDVEVAAHEVLIENMNSDAFNVLKNWVYNSPTQKIKMADGSESDYTITMGDVCFILSLPLRDKYLELHPQLV